MEPRDLNRMFDRLAPTPEQERAVLERLLHEERKVRPMKKLKKLTVVGIAAALMVITCAAAVVTGFDQRLADYFGASPEQVEQLSSAVAAMEPVSHTYESGWTVQISQVLSDRYMVAALIDFTAPAGTVLSIPENTTAARELALMVDYRIEDRSGNLIAYLKDAPLIPSAFDADDGRPLFYVADWDGEEEGDGLDDFEILEDSALEQGRISGLWTYKRGTAFQDFAGDELLGAHVSIMPKGVTFRSTYETIYFEDETEQWSYDLTLPETDSGSFYIMETQLQMGSYALELKKIYLSPLELAYEYYIPAGTPSDCNHLLYDKEARAYAINLADGTSVSVKDAFNQAATSTLDGDGFTHIGLYPVRFIAPKEVVSFSMFGQTYELK